MTPLPPRGTQTLENTASGPSKQILPRSSPIPQPLKRNGSSNHVITAHTMEPGDGSKDADGYAMDGVDDVIENYATPYGVDDIIENYILMLEEHGSEEDFIMVSVDINAGSTATSVSKDADGHDIDDVDDIIENYMRAVDEIGREDDFIIFII